MIAELRATKRHLSDKEPITIAALGDSLTQGWMVRKGYVDFLEEMLNWHYSRSDISILNRGVPGDTAEGGLHRLRRHVLDNNPHCTLIQFGLNDAYLGYSVGSYKNNIKNIIESIRLDTDSEILLVTSVPIMNERENAMAENFYNALEELAETFETDLARVHAYWQSRVAEGVDWDSLVQFDGVHPTVEGYRIMAEVIGGHFIS